MIYEYPTAFESWGDEEPDAIARVIRSGRFTMGPEVEALEHELATYHGVKYAVAVNSGSSANLVAVAALCNLSNSPLRRGDRVVVPALAWPTTYAPLVQHGCKLLVADCDSTWNVNEFPLLFVPSDIAAFVSVSVLGNPANVTAVRAVCVSHGIHVIEDACESLGARHNGQLIGTFGRMGTLSFFHSHQLSAIEGGAILTNDPECATLCRMLRNHGWTRGTDKGLPGFEHEYDFRLHGYNVRPLEMHAAIARAQLAKLERFKKARLTNWLQFYMQAEHLPITFQEMNDGESNPFGIAFTVETKEARARLAQALRANGVDCRPPVGGSFGRHPYAKLANWTGDTPMADRIHDTGLFLGLAPFPIPDLIDKAVKVMKATL